MTIYLDSKASRKRSSLSWDPGDLLAWSPDSSVPVPPPVDWLLDDTPIPTEMRLPRKAKKAKRANPFPEVTLICLDS